MTEPEAETLTRISELREELAFLNRAVESAKNWQSRSWAKRGFHRWEPPKRIQPEPNLTPSVPSISPAEAELLAEIRYLAVVVESAKKWQRRSLVKRALHKWRAPKRLKSLPDLVQIAPEQGGRPAEPSLPPPYRVASSLKRPLFQLPNGRAFGPEQARFLDISYEYLDTFLKSRSFSESLDKVRELDPSIPGLESWYTCAPVIPPLGLAQYQLFSEISDSLMPQLETDCYDIVLLIENNETLQSSLVEALNITGQRYKAAEFLDRLPRSDRDTAIRTLANILFGLGSKDILANRNSVAWSVFVRFGKQLAQFTKLHLVLDNSDSDLDFEEFSGVFPYVTSILCADKSVYNRIVRFNIPAKYKERIVVIGGGINRFFNQYKGSEAGFSQVINKETESLEPIIPYDISAILNLHREGLICGPTLENFTQAIEYAEEKGLRVEGIIICDRPDALTLAMVPERFRLVETNFGDPAVARNAGIAEARGKFICFLDGDDFWCEDWLVKCHRYFEISPEACVLHPALNLYFGTSQGIMPHPDSLHPAFDLNALRVENLWTNPSFAPRELFLKNTYRASDLKLGFGHEDWHWNSQLLASGIAHRPCANTFHIIRQKRQSRSSECDSLDARVWPSAITALSFKGPLKSGITISLLHATRKRAEKALQTRNMWIERAKYPQLIEHIFAYDNDDLESRAAFRDVGHIEIQDGGTCIKAWNTAAELSRGDILLQLSDDWIPSEFWDQAILSRLDVNKPQVLAISDGHRKDQLLCMAILTRKRFIDQKYFFHPDFESVYSDDWFTFAAYRDGVVVEAKDIIFTHDHPYHKGN